MAPYLDNVLRKTWRIGTRSFWDHEDSAKSGEVGSQPYEKGAREERMLVGDGLCEHRWNVVAFEQLPMIRVCLEDLMLSMIH